MNQSVSSQKLSGRKALITGASRGIGRAIAVKYAQEGADLFLCATDMKKLEETRAQASEFGNRIELYSVDVAERNAVETMVQTAVDTLGQVDVLVNSAGTYKPSPFVDYTFEDFDRIMKVNLYGPFNVTQFVLRDMLKRNQGKVVNIASTAGKWASANQSAYNMSKHGLVGMTRCLGLEMAQKGITVNAICPGVVETDMMLCEFGQGHAKIMGTTPDEALAWVKQRIPMGRWLKAEEIAFLAVYLASSESDGMTGQSILLDAGMLYV
ncbi:MAG: SDR family oxidoreductase [Desulfatiglans sp.]|jgi:NAD(P)-dependent dehydrogenase (short-subunit alcohol dehydrogenase family)|nr:SDR family oxidoreductase [Thermodesulfobacteriota bacterium]MEE4351689.1 SDR family oxidoreductase [Desulfatiglans sp.]